MDKEKYNSKLVKNLIRKPKSLFTTIVIVIMLIIVGLTLNYMFSGIKYIPIDMNSNNIATLDMQKLYESLLAEMKPDNNKLFVSNGRFGFKFYFDGTIYNFYSYSQIHLLKDRDIITYQLSFRENDKPAFRELTIWENGYIQDTDIDIQFILQGISILPWQSILGEYQEGTPDFYTLESWGFSYSTNPWMWGKDRQVHQFKISNNRIEKIEGKTTFNEKHLFIEVIPYYEDKDYKGRLSPENILLFYIDLECFDIT